MCPHFAVGKCFYGNNCKYKHPGQMNNLFYGIGQPMPSPYDPPLMMNMAPFNPMMMNHAMPSMRMRIKLIAFLRYSTVVLRKRNLIPLSVC